MSQSNMFPGSQPDPDARTLENDSERIAVSAESVESKVYAGKRLARFFELEISIRIFGQEIWHWIFPPKNN